MKKRMLAPFFATFILSNLSVFGAIHPESIRKQSFTHKFGAEVSQEEWESRGKTGDVISTQANGVVVTQHFYKGILQGKMTFSYPNSSIIQKTEVYEDGKLLSTIFHYPSGTHREEVVPLNSSLVQVTRWYEDGTPKSVEELDRMLLANGTYYSPHNEEDSKVTGGFGVRTVRNDQGELLSKDTIQNGIMVLRTTYYPSGEPFTLTTFENGIIHGTHQIFDEGGMPKEIQEWSNGRREGLTTLFIAGEKVGEVPYSKGKKNGLERRFEGGNVVLEVNWVGGLKNGSSTKYSNQGKEVQYFLFGQPLAAPKKITPRPKVPSSSMAPKKK